MVEGIAVEVVFGFNLVCSFESWKFIFRSFLFISSYFRGKKGSRECSRECGVDEFCILMFGKRVVVAFISVASADDEEAVKGG